MTGNHATQEMRQQNAGGWEAHKAACSHSKELFITQHSPITRCSHPLEALNPR
jgi:hypothetical protein